MEQEKFEIYALIELMGHARIAGKVTEQVIAGQGFIRVDVPETKTNPPFTRFISPSAVYAINPVTPEVMQQFAHNINAAPIQPWDIMDAVKRMKSLPGHQYGQGDE